MRYQATLFVFVCTLLVSSTAWAMGTDSCTVPPLTEEDFLQSLDRPLISHACDNDFFAEAWSTMNLEQSWWDDGWGYHDPCNIRLPMARLFNAAHVIYRATPTWWDYLEYRLDRGNHKIRPGCAKDEENRANATTYVNIYLWLNNLYHSNAVSRASTIVHEVRHTYSGGSHNGGSDCPRGASCDERWSDNRANTVQVKFLRDLFCSRMGFVTPVMREYAAIRAKSVLTRGYVHAPPLRVLYNRCADSDNDNIPDHYDNCLHVDNPTQEDSDGDGAGDACDCAPQDPDIRPGIREICGNNIDNNCDGVIDGYTHSVDGDHDGIPDDCDPHCDKNTVMQWIPSESTFGCACPIGASFHQDVDTCVCNSEREKMDPASGRCFRCPGGQVFAFPADETDLTCVCPDTMFWYASHCICHPGEWYDVFGGECVSIFCDPALGYMYSPPDPSSGYGGGCTCAPPWHPDFKDGCIM